MDVSKDPKVIEYAWTMTGLPEFYIMKAVLINIFGDNAKVSFENIEDMRSVIEDNYTNEELGLISSGVSNLNVFSVSLSLNLQFSNSPSLDRRYSNTK